MGDTVLMKDIDAVAAMKEMMELAAPADEELPPGSKSDCSTYLKVVEAQLAGKQPSIRGKFAVSVAGAATCVCRHECFLKVCLSKRPEHYSLMAAMFVDVVHDGWNPKALCYDINCRVRNDSRECIRMR